MGKIRIFGAISLLASVIACPGRDDTSKKEALVMPDDLPVMTNSELPFRYPPALYAQRVQGNVTLRIHIDSTGKIDPDSTKVVETSGQSALDSAAVRGARDLSFVPAKRRGVSVPVSILFPVYFRHPEAPALPGDSALKKDSVKKP